MTKFKATVTEDVEANRLMIKNVNGGKINLAIAKSGDTPEFRSTGELKEGQEVTVTIKGSISWNLEAGSSINAGDNVGVGEAGKAIVSDDSFGYAVNDAVAGKLVEVVRQSSGEKGPKGDQGAQGPPGKDGTNGAKGDKGENGTNGKDGFPTETQWNDLVAEVEALKGN